MFLKITFHNLELHTANFVSFKDVLIEYCLWDAMKNLLIHLAMLGLRVQGLASFLRY